MLVMQYTSLSKKEICIQNITAFTRAERRPCINILQSIKQIIMFGGLRKVELQPTQWKQENYTKTNVHKCSGFWTFYCKLNIYIFKYI